MEKDSNHAPGTDKSALSIAIIRVEAMTCGRRRDMRQLRESEPPVGCRPRCELSGRNTSSSRCSHFAAVAAAADDGPDKSVLEKP